MATAELGVRIVLEDSAKTGLDTLGLSFLGLHGVIGRLALIAMSQQLTPQMKIAGATAEITGLAFKDLVGFIGDTVQAAADLQSELTKISLSVDGADQNAQQMSDTLVNLADASMYSTAQIADGFAQMGIDGFNATQIMDGMGQSGVILAEALNSETTPAFNLLATAMELYRADASDAGQYTKDLTFLFYHGEKTIANVQAALQQVGPTASLLKVPFGELADVLALLGEDGLKGGQGAAALNYYLTALSSPIPKAQKALAALGLMIVDDTNPAVEGLVKQLRAAGVSAQDLKLDGTVSQLQRLFDMGTKLNILHTDKTFMEWATSLGVVKNKMYDANGNFIGLTNSILKLGDAMKGMTEQQKADFIAQLFNVRSGRVARDLLNNIETQLSRIGQLDSLRQATDPAGKAAENLNTLNNTLLRLSSTWTDFKARLGNADLGPLGTIGNEIADMLHQFNIASPQLQTFGAVVLVLAAAFTGLVFVVSSAVFAWGVFGGIIAAVLPFIIILAPIFLQIAAGIAVVAWFIAQATDKTSQFYAIAHPIFTTIQQIFAFIGDEITGQLLPALGKLGLNMDNLKIIGIVLLAVFVAPIILMLGILIVTITVVVTVVTKFVLVLTWLQSTGTAVAHVLANFFRSIPGAVTGAFAAIGDAIHNGTATAAGFVNSFISGVKNAIFGGFHWIQDTIKNAVNTVVGWFSWLYNHNYYFQMLVDYVRLQFTNARNFVIAIWTTITSWLTDKFNLIKNTVTSVFTTIGAVIHDKIEHVKSVILAAWGAITVYFNDAKSHVVKIVTELWNGLVSKFTEGKDHVVRPITNLKDTIVNIFNGLKTILFNAGKSLIDMLINGITSKIGDLRNTLGNVAGNIAKFLGFHSPTEEGPGAQAHLWAPAFMKMFAGGIEQHVPLVSTAVNKAALAMSRVGTIAGNYAHAAAGSGNSAAVAGQGDIHIYIDGQEVTGRVLKRVDKTLSVNGINRTMR